MPPAARVTDMHVCPMVTGVVPHVGGPILPPCAPTVLIGFLPAARVTDLATCAGPPDVIVKGGDYTIEQIVGADEVLAYGGKVVINPIVQGFSTTGLIDKIRKL